MKKDKTNNENYKVKKQFDKGQIFVKIMAGILACLMIFSVAISLIYALI